MNNTFTWDEFPLLNTERLHLRKITKEDAKAIYDCFSDLEVTQYYGMDPLISLTEAEEFVTHFENGFNNKQTLRWGMVLKETNEFIGTIGFHLVNGRHSRCEVGYEIAKPYWKKGYASEALKEVVSFGLEQFNMNRIGATVRPENIPSRKLLEKIGFLQEGLLRDYQYMNSQYYDLYMYSILNDKQSN